MVKVDRTLRFLIIIGILILIDASVDLTTLFNKLLQMIILDIFDLKIKNGAEIYTSLYASIAIVLSSSVAVIKKIGYSAGLLAMYIFIFTFITAYRFMYPSYSLYLTLLVFITMTFPILLWILLIKNKEPEKSKKHK